MYGIVLVKHAVCYVHACFTLLQTVQNRWIFIIRPTYAILIWRLNMKVFKSDICSGALICIFDLMPHIISHQVGYVEPSLNYCWPTIYDTGPSPDQQRLNVS